MEDKDSPTFSLEILFLICGFLLLSLYNVGGDSSPEYQCTLWSYGSVNAACFTGLSDRNVKFITMGNYSLLA